MIFYAFILSSSLIDCQKLGMHLAGIHYIYVTIRLYYFRHLMKIKKNYILMITFIYIPHILHTFKNDMQDTTEI